jgi:hypothetical protein
MLVRATVVAAFLLLFAGGALSAVPIISGGPTPAIAAGPSTENGEKEESKDQKSWAENAEKWLKVWVTIVGLVVGAILVIGGLMVITWVAFGRRKASLTIEAFGDGGVDAKVGAVMTGMVQKRLAELSDRSGHPYRLDLAISADVVLLARSESLQTALAGLADSSQFKVVVALLALIDQKIGNHLVAKGELAAPGTDGYGVVLSLQSQKNGIESNGSLWDGAVGGSPPGDSSKAGPYYKLADRSAAWIQYESARALDKSGVSLMTNSAESFSLVSEALARKRDGDSAAAADLYAEALKVDRENVAALINLSALMASEYELFRPAVALLDLARVALRRRYQAVG